MREFLLFRLYGPLTSWGEVAVGEVRPSQALPTKSALMGLLAGSLGLRRDQEAELGALHDSYGLALLVESRGLPLRDFQTVEVPRARRGAFFATRRDELLGLDHKDNPIVSFRDYRVEALYAACLWEADPDPPHPLSHLARALEKPRFTPYLGRKSCPLALPFKPHLVRAQTIREAIEAARFPDSDLINRLRSNVSAEIFWEKTPDGPPAGLEPTQRFTRRDALLSRRRWQFRTRQENQAAWPAREAKEA